MLQKGILTGGPFIKSLFKVHREKLTPILFFGCQHFHITTATSDTLNKANAKILRKFLDLPRRSPTLWVLYLTSSLPAHIRLQLETVLPWSKYIRLRNGLPIKPIKSVLKPTVPSARPDFQQRVSNILQEWGVSHLKIERWSAGHASLPSISAWPGLVRTLACTQAQLYFQEAFTLNPHYCQFLYYKPLFNIPPPSVLH
jgi:hypothetical protein